MRGGLSTIQQTLTPEAATVLNHSIAEAGRRNHGQTTPLHVAATLLAAPSGFLRQACIRSHPNSSHPLQCRALELCFSVALDRLPTAQNASSEPSISNALMAALKRSQAHQRRGCPEQQQQPLLAVKVELEQLIVSILDDPSVSRVMREASFSSPAVKASIEQSLNVNPTPNNPTGIGFRPPIPMFPILPNRNTSYLNPRFQQQQHQQHQHQHQYQQGDPVQSSSDLVLSSDRNTPSYLNPRLQQGNSGEQRTADEVQRVVEILLKTKKRNPILVGETEPEAIVKEILRKIEKGELAEEKLKNVQVISIEQEFSLSSDKNQIPAKIKELGTLIETRIGSPDCGGIIIDLSDLKWLVDQPPPATASLGVPQQVVSESSKEAVAEMGRLMAKFGEESGTSSKVWMIGTATCETYLRCQVYHPSMETDWDLQALPITARSPLPRMFSRMGSTNGILSSSVESLNPLKSFGTGTASTLPKRLLENVDSARSLPPCPKCFASCEQELAKLVDTHRPSSDEVAVKSDTSGSPLPRWLQNAKSQSGEVKGTDPSKIKDQELVLKQKTQELQRRWRETCSRLHPSHQNQGCERRAPVTSICNPNLVMMQPKLQLHRTATLQDPLQVKQNRETNHLSERPGSPVRTDLVLGSKGDGDLPVKDLLGCISSEPVDRFLPEFQKGKFASASDADLFKKLLRALMKKAWWQPEAASAVATTITQCKFGEGNRLGGTGSKNGSIWLLFTGPDRAGKKKMAYVLAEHVCGANPITICLGSRRDEEEQLDLSFRGKTALDRIVEAVRRNPFSVIMLMDIDEADMLVRGNIKRAMERGRIADSHGREISLGNVIFILMGNWSTVNIDEHLVDEQRLRSVANSEWNLRLTIGEKRTTKRRADWLLNKDRRAATKPRKEDTGFGSCFSLDLNQAADAEDDRADGSVNSSDLTTDQEDNHIQFSVTSVPHELVSSSDGAIVFKPANFKLICREIEKTITKAFSTVVDDKLLIKVEESTLESILGGLWFGRTGLEEWAEQVLVPSFHRLKARLPSSPDENLVVRLELDWKQNPVSHRDWLPSQIAIAGGVVDGE